MAWHSQISIGNQPRMSKKRKFKVEAEIVNGKCPTCDQFTMLVGIEQSFFRCMNCGSDLEQHINGKITYLPVITAPADGAKPFVKEWLDLMQREAKIVSKIKGLTGIDVEIHAARSIAKAFDKLKIMLNLWVTSL